MMVLPAPGSSASRKRMRGSHEILIDRFKLVRQRVNPGDGQGEIRVVFKRQCEAHGLHGEPETQRVAVEWFGVRRGFERGELVRRKNGFIHLAGVDPFADELHRVAHRNADDDLNRFGENRPAQNFVRL